MRAGLSAGCLPVLPAEGYPLGALLCAPKPCEPIGLGPEAVRGVPDGERKPAITSPGPSRGRPKAKKMAAQAAAEAIRLSRSAL
jgi:hypothetical protein